MRTKQTANLFREIAIPPDCDVDDGGVWMDLGDGHLTRISNVPAWVSALLCDADGENWAVVVEFIDPDGDRREQVVEYGSLFQEGPDLMEDLAVQGLLLLPKYAADVRAYLAICATQDDVPHVRGAR